MAKRTNLEKADELLWAKLQGDWTDDNYRYEVAKKGLCLEELAGDMNRAVAACATGQIVHKALKEIRNKNV